MSGQCYIDTCEAPAEYLATISDGWCRQGPECPGHGYCTEHAASFRRQGRVSSIRSLRRSAVTE